MVARSCCAWIGAYYAEFGTECARCAGGDADVDGRKQRSGGHGDVHSVACLVHTGRWDSDGGVLPAAGHGEFADAGICGERWEDDMGGVEGFEAFAGAIEQRCAAVPADEQRTEREIQNSENIRKRSSAGCGADRGYASGAGRVRIVCPGGSLLEEQRVWRHGIYAGWGAGYTEGRCGVRVDGRAGIY